MTDDKLKKDAMLIDESEIQIKIGLTKQNKVLIDFGAQVTWLAFDKEEALTLAAKLNELASAIKPAEDPNVQS